MPKADSQFRFGPVGKPGRPTEGGAQCARDRPAAHCCGHGDVGNRDANRQKQRTGHRRPRHCWIAVGASRTQSVEMSGDRTTLVDLLVSLNSNDHAIEGEPGADRGDSDGDLHHAVDPIH